jgi:hypothetical protein
MTTDGATIKSISENVVVNPGDEAKLSCAVDGKFVRESFCFMIFRFIITVSEGNQEALVASVD